MPDPLPDPRLTIAAPDLLAALRVWRALLAVRPDAAFRAWAPFFPIEEAREMTEAAMAKATERKK